MQYAAHMNLALASCTTVLGSEADDGPLHAALRARGATVATPAWDDPDVDWARFDACLIRGTWDYMDRRDTFLEWGEHVTACSQLFNPLPVVRWNTLKTYLRELEARDVPIAPTIWVDAGETIDLAAELAERGWFKAFIKPMIGADARETLPFVANPTELEKAQTHIDRLLVREGVMVQPFLESVRTEGEYSVIFIDGVATHTLRKIPLRDDYRVMDNYGGSDEPFELPPADMLLAREVCQTCEDILGCDGPLLYARVDFLRGATGSLLVNEVELVEPSLFFRHCKDAADALATSFLRRLAT